MLEITFIAYILSLVSIVTNIWLWSEVRDLKQQRKRDQISKRLSTITRSVQPPAKKGPWGY